MQDCDGSTLHEVGGMIDFAQFIGPLGGLLCIAWAMGAISGYTFHSRAIYAFHKQLYEAQLAELREEMEQLRARVKNLQARQVQRLQEQRNQRRLSDG